MSRRYMRDFIVQYEQQSKASVLSPGQGEQIHLYAAHLLNRSGAAQDLAILKKLSVEDWKLWSYVDPNATTDQTAAIQAGSTVDIFTTTVNDGFLIQSASVFNLVGFAVSQAQSGAPVYSFQYWNGAAFVPLPNVISTPDYSVVGDDVLMFPTPRLWVPGADPAFNVDAGKYTLLVQATTASGTAVQANDLWVGHLLAFMPQVPDKAQLSLMYDDHFPRIFNGDEGILPFFSVANAANLVTVKYFPQ